MTIRYFALPLFFSVHVFAADYDVTIDGKTHAFAEGVEQTIQTAAGEIRISVKAPRLKVCKEDGFTFDYPADMKVEPEDLDGGIRQVTVEAIDSTIIRVPSRTRPAPRPASRPWRSPCAEETLRDPRLPETPARCIMPR